MTGVVPERQVMLCRVGNAVTGGRVRLRRVGSIDTERQAMQYCLRNTDTEGQVRLQRVGRKVSASCGKLDGSCHMRI